MTISDFDEVLYLRGGGDIKEYLELKSSEGYNWLNQMMVETCFENFPNKSILVHENENCIGNFWEYGCKMTLFRIDVMSDITYAPGAHSVKIVYFKNKELKSLNNLDICSFHLKYLDIDYCANKNRNAAKRLSEENEQHGWGIQYHDSDEKFRDEYRKRIKEGFLINDYVSGKVKIIDNEKKTNS